MYNPQKTEIPSSDKGLVVGIDASRNRSGGAKAHIIGILSASSPEKFGITKVHLWSYKALLDSIPDAPWLVKHCPEEIEKSLLHQLVWQYKNLSVELKRNKCDVLLTTDAGSVCRFNPSVVMSRDMLSFEPGEISRYGISLAWLRLFVLRYVQVSALKNASSALFLTQYAADMIQKFSGKLKNIRVIPHGLSENFFVEYPDKSWPAEGEPIVCTYVSNADLYKHQWHVIDAVSRLKRSGYNIKLELVGAGSGHAAARVSEAVALHDPEGNYIKVMNLVPHKDVPAYLRKSDVFIFASSCENMPNTLIEAMASSLPIACSNRGPMPEILTDAGSYFDPEDAASIMGSIKAILDNVEYRNELAKKAKLLSLKYSWKTCGESTWGFLRETAINNFNS